MPDFLVTNSPGGDRVRVYSDVRFVCTNALAEPLANPLVGYHVPRGYVCTDPECLAFYEVSDLGGPVYEADAYDEGRVLSCQSCTEPLTLEAERIAEFGR